MNEDEFRERLAAAQDNIKASPELKHRVVAEALQADAAGGENRAAQSHAAPTRRPTRRRPQPAKRAPGAAALARRWALPAAACLVAGALVVAGVPALTSALHGGSSATSSIALDEAAARCGFSVQAWASDRSTVLEPSEDDMIVFDRDLSNGMYEGERYKTEGYYTGCLFSVEGEGIARVQMNVSHGRLYRFTTELCTNEEEPEKWAEALSWKPTKRGMGTYFSTYDSVVPIGKSGGVSEGSHGKLAGVNLAKIFGSTIDVTSAEEPGIADGTTSFGLWTNDDYDEEAGVFPIDTAVDLFDGQTLTVTVTFEDGHCTTQVIELHAADMKAVSASTESLGGRQHQVVPEIVQDRGSLREGETFVHTLYGIIIETNSEPFAGDLSQANEYAANVMPAMTLDRQPIVKPAQRDGHALAVTEGARLEPGDRAFVSDEDGSTASFSLSFPAVERTRALPEALALEDVLGETDAAYANRISEQVHGYRIDEETREISDGFSFATVTMNVTNEAAEARQLPLNSERLRELGLGEFAVVDGQGNATFNALNEALYFGDGGENLKGANPCALSFEPGETKRVTIIKIVPDSVLDDPSCLFVVDVAGAGITQAFAVGAQR
ncbi:hypothetical protein [Gordonibacter massiliensis (ex Traore et al. 2017)]|uniref:hypothetical protein n=1 Tax=Gordonibacter massiliensis (ex Traore et al. 2017) TaxID=1841863 RepID=UPI001C8BC137|nr:hypothetical protein [Gordonibacter massiliensis (ex Traore et al. 2017)]MBX9034703.1 hypothetical protein [Gordonibacter massiliensis (ex Traore et al. 2017)]